MITPKQASDFVSRSREAARMAKKLKDEITSLTDVYVEQKILTDLNTGHLSGDHEGLDLAEFQAAVLGLGAIKANIILDPTGADTSILSKILKIV